MSSNPFRQKINEAAQSSIPANPATGTSTIQPLAINTGARPEKHVRIASPPDTQISPASYPSSPDFARLSPSPQPTIVPYTFNAASQTPVADPFTAADSSGDDDDDDGHVVSEALKNTRLNIAASRPPPESSGPTPARSEDAVQNTLAKFASRPKDVKPQVTEGGPAAPKQDVKRQTMDVDAFTKLLLTGGGSAQGQPGGSSTVSTAGPANPLSESSSTADSASISRQSIFELMPPIVAESPRTSQELDETEASLTRRAIGPGEVSENVKKPPPAPRPRHGKPIKPPLAKTVPEAAVNISTASPTSPSIRPPGSDLDKPLPPPPASDSSRRGSASSTSFVGTDPSMQIKRPPTPPLTRRRSQGPSKPPLSRSSPSLQSVTTSPQSPSSSSSLSLPSKAAAPPPPPPSRRISQRLSETVPSSMPPFSEETHDDAEGPDLSKLILPKLSRTTSATTRASIISSNAENAPPPPPPRRHRGSSNASQQQPGTAHAESSSSSIRRGSVEVSRPYVVDTSTTTRKTSDGSNRDILADLAALQREVDALKAKGFRD